ncbi:hypothetical protein MCHI_002848 [Candidatus Magnetoovum chiemensis]|nr:hypothetical protein MCHI_002848 [Candidatus Magnetoovum chiemensis]
MMWEALCRRISRPSLVSGVISSMVVFSSRLSMFGIWFRSR